MARRRVTGCRKARSGTILGLSGPSFGYRREEEVIEDIEARSHRYYVREGPHDSDVRIESTAGEKHLVTTRNILSPNHLQNLPSR